MKNYSLDVKFKADDSKVGKTNLESTLALVNNTHSSDENAIEEATKFFKEYNFDFHSEKDVPRELPALYERNENERNQLTIFSPREGHIKRVYENPEKQDNLIVPNGRDNDWMYFYSAQTDYAVKI